MNFAGWSASLGLPTLLVLAITYMTTTRKRRVDYAAALQKMALDQAEQLDERLAKSEARAVNLEQRLNAMSAVVDAALERARRAEEESELRGAALRAAQLPVPVVARVA